MTNNRWVQLCIFLALAGLMMAMSGYGFLSVIIILGLVFVSLRFATKPFSQAIARIRASIRWKFEIAIALIAALFLFVGLFAFGAMDFSQPLHVDNRDELGDLAYRINETSGELEKLQEAILTEERAGALRERMTQVTLAQEEERRRISRELHDGLGPSLAGIGNRIKATQRTLRSDPQAAERELEETAGILRGHVQEIRGLIYDLRPLALDQLGLVGALDQQVERFGQDTGVQASFDGPGKVALNPLAEVTLLREVQECLSNIQKHADATRVEVGLQMTDSRLELRVIDNGRGFNPTGVSSGSADSGLGLRGMQERAELLGGSLSVDSSPGGGCQVIFSIQSTEVEDGDDPHPSGR